MRTVCCSSRLSEGVSTREGVCLGGVSAQGVSARGVCLPGQGCVCQTPLPPVDRMTDRCT